MSELIDMSSQFKGLPMAELIGAPLSAACDAQLKLAMSTANFIETMGFEPDEKGKPGKTRVANFAYTRTGPDGKKEDVTLAVPLLAIIKIPTLAVTRVDVTFDMEVKSSSVQKTSEDQAHKYSADMSIGYSCFSLNVHVEGSVASHKENTRSSDNSAKYHVAVHAEDTGMPEGLARVLDILQQAIQSPASSNADATKSNAAQPA
jgi:hypothetical protein